MESPLSRYAAAFPALAIALCAAYDRQARAAGRFGLASRYARVCPRLVGLAIVVAGRAAAVTAGPISNGDRYALHVQVDSTQLGSS